MPARHRPISATHGISVSVTSARGWVAVPSVATVRGVIAHYSYTMDTTMYVWYVVSMCFCYKILKRRKFVFSVEHI